MPVLLWIQAEPFHLPRQIRSNGLRRIGDPGRDDRLHAHPALAIVLGQQLGAAAELRLRFLPHGARRLRQYLLQQVFGGVVPVHFRYSNSQDPPKMLRDPSLIPLSHQHHNGLAMCVLTRRSLSEDSSEANVARLARKVIDRYELELVNHFEIEEQVLFPACGAMPLVAELLAEHRGIEALILELRNAPSAELL